MKETRKLNIVILVTMIFSLVYPYIALLYTLPAYLLPLESVLVYALPMIIYLLFFGGDRSVVSAKTLPASVYLKCILLYICLTPIFELINGISMLIVPNAVVENYSYFSQIPGWALIIGVALLPPVSEELIYRGVVYGTYRRVNPLAGIIISGLTFGIMHQNLNQFMYAAVLGMVFAILVEATDSVIPSMIVHSLINLIPISLLVLLPKYCQYINDIYSEAVNMGDTVTAAAIEAITGGAEMTPETFFAAGSYTASQFLQMLPGMLIKAVIGGALSFLLIRSIGRRCGNWDRVKGIFSRNREKREGIVSGAWIAYAIIGGIVMVLVAVGQRLPG